MAITFKAATRFESGDLMLSQGMDELMRSDWALMSDICDLLKRHQKCDHGFLTEDESYKNQLALKNQGVIVSKYLLGGKEIVIATSGDRRITTAYLQTEDNCLEPQP